MDLTRMIFIIFFIIIGFDLFLWLRKNLYVKAFQVSAGATSILWFLYFLIDLLDIDFIFSRPLLILTDFLFNICFTIITPALTLILMSEIKNKTSKYTEVKIFNNYHLHEGLFGIFLIFIAFILCLFYFFLDDYVITKNSLEWLLTVLRIVMINLTFFGGFFILRDRKDILKFKLLERKSQQEGFKNPKVRSKFLKNMDHNSVSFFTKPRIILYPIGMFICSISINMIIHGRNFLPKEIFHLKENQIIIWGFLFLFIGSGFLGIDWLRIFQILYPGLYKEIDFGLEVFRKNYTKKSPKKKN